jgi:hypothetical protein
MFLLLVSCTEVFRNMIQGELLYYHYYPYHLTDYSKAMNLTVPINVAGFIAPTLRGSNAPHVSYGISKASTSLRASSNARTVVGSSTGRTKSKLISKPFMPAKDIVV